MKVIRGKDFILSIVKNGVPTPVCYSLDFTLQAARDTIEKTPLTGLDKDYIVTFKGYTLGISTVVSYFDGFSFIDLNEAFENGTRLVWSATDSANGGVVHKGVCIINNIAFASPVRGEFSSDASAVGCGPRELLKLPISSTVYLADQAGVQLPGCPNPYPVSVFWYDMTFIGLADNADEVVQIYNDYPGNLYYTLSLGEDGCHFNLQSEWNAPFIPTFVIAEASPDMALSSDQINNIVLSPDQDNDQALSPSYS